MYRHVVSNDGDFTGVAEDSWFGNYPRTATYGALSIYTATPNWSDAEFDRRLAAATSTTGPTIRMEKLAVCEARLLRAMPFVPLFISTPGPIWSDRKFAGWA